MKGLFIAVSALTVYSASAGIVFEDTFEGDAVGAIPSAVEWTNTEGMNIAEGVPLGTRWLEMKSDTAWSFGALNPPDAAVMTLSFDAYFGSAAFGDGYLRMNMKGNYGVLNRLDWGKSWDMRKGSEFALDTVQHVDVVMNMSGSPVTYDGSSLAHDEFAVWIDGTRVLQDAMDQSGSETNTVISDIGMWMNAGSASSAVYIDNVTVRDEAYVYEKPAPAYYPHTDPENTGNWVLLEAVSDEFEGTHLDETKWQICGRDGVYWNNQFSGRSYSTTNGDNWDTGWEYSPDNLQVTNGMLKIRTEYDPSFNWVNDPYGYNEFTTGGMWSKALSGETGYMEIRCKHPDASTVAAFWTTAGPEGPACEIDVFEAIGSPSSNYSRTNKMWSSLHDWSKPIPNSPWTETTELPFNFKDGFHTYAAEWDEENLKIYADGQLIHSTTRSWVETNGIHSTQWPLPGSQHIWADAEIFPWWGTPDPSSLPAEFEVEYIRVWEKGTPTAWHNFAEKYLLSGVKTNHSDSDRLNDWGEYVFGGNPTNGDDFGVLPSFDVDTGEYSFSLIGDDSVVARIVSTTDLKQGPWITNNTVWVSATNGMLNSYAHTFGTDGKNLFVKLEID
ncbi:glycoside hydrolase family 16 protein [Pontiella agarivorans]|uniref:Family 16 glycosylhydrolase n=1 Tax=Pontiella agarivorans TaxID=3038953 RepID=A0ABU5MUE1_9BACT|nr:family 16 glycosylhydrolase [Pontiella agarivorans]MDZ8117772.1 family 16 glycosylhydrolase [Pontiella agarivorans]